MKGTRMLVISLSGLNCTFWFTYGVQTGKANILNHTGLIRVMCKEKVLFWCQYLDCDLNHYSSKYLTVCPSTPIDLLKGFYSFYPTSFHLPFIGSYPSLQGNKGITVTFQLHLPHGRKERKQQCKVHFGKIISTSININKDNNLQHFNLLHLLKSKKKDTRHQSA